MSVVVDAHTGLLEIVVPRADDRAIAWLLGYRYALEMFTNTE